MNVFLKADLKKLGFCAALFAVLYVLLEMEIIGAFWELNLVLIIINIILATARASIGALLYNVSAAFVGGVHLTLADE